MIQGERDSLTKSLFLFFFSNANTGYDYEEELGYDGGYGGGYGGKGMGGRGGMSGPGGGGWGGGPQPLLPRGMSTGLKNFIPDTNL